MNEALRLKYPDRREIMGAIDGALEEARDQPWPAKLRARTMFDPVTYNRSGLAKAVVRAFKLTTKLGTHHRQLLTGSQAELAQWLPVGLEDIDATEILDWLEKKLSIEWIDDRLAVPEAKRSELAAIIRQALSGVVDGELTPNARAAVAREVFRRIMTATDGKRFPKVEKSFAQCFIGWAWGSRREPEVRVELALQWLESELRIEWSKPPRPDLEYSPRGTYQVGDVVVHSRFGRGKVIAKASNTSVEVAFADGSRRLSCR